MFNRIAIFIVLMHCSGIMNGQTMRPSGDSTALTSALPAKYVEQVSSKTGKYYNSITSKTEKTLERLSKWEAKIKTILEKTSPETAQRLFGNNQLTFATLLQKYKEGKAAADNYKGKYDEYRDKVTTSLRYVRDSAERFKSLRFNSSRVEVDSSQGRSRMPISTAVQKITKLNEQVRQTEAVEEFIKERKKQLMQQALQYIGKSKYLQKINKESYYYIETLRNYKEIFSDPKKTEEVAMGLLQKIPAFGDFMRKNSMFASMFGVPGGAGNLSSSGEANMSGLQARVQLNGLLQQQFSAGGPNVQQQLRQNLQSAQTQVQQFTDKLNRSGGGGDEVPDFKVNNQKTKPFLKRLELGTTLQTQKADNYFPTTSDIGLSIGYKLNDKSVIGIGASYKLGLGNGWRSIRITNEGVGVRSFIDWRLKGSLYISGGYEQNYRTAFNSIEQLKNLSAWQQSGLIGFSKKYKISKKYKGSMQVSWDFMSYQQIPRTQPIIFRFGFSLK